MNKLKLGRWLAWTSLVGIGISIVILLYWLYSVPAQVISVSKSPIPVTTPTAQPGGYVILRYGYCKHVKSTGRVVIGLVGQTSQLNLPTGYESSKRGCYNDLQVPLPVPPLATPGKYHFHFRATYQVNPLKSVTQDYDTQSFMVL